ncbi:MAG: shikimate dehydrogenase [Lachnospiraceae bacterium]|nr:shikimate dehydrogenase [Lachnospiraceae bacterium]
MNNSEILKTHIDGQTRLLGLLGHPARHSISPAMHSMAASLLKLPYVYLSFDVKPSELEKAVESLRFLDAKGFNLTMPHKVAVIPMLDELSRAAELSGAVNTVVIRDDGSLYGDTTDGRGFLDGLNANGVDYKNSVMTLLGAGGAATAICVSAALSGVSEIRMFKRKSETFEETKRFVNKISEQTGCKITLTDLASDNDLRKSIDESLILVNATNVGMGDDDRSLVPKEFLGKGLFVCDIIYEPRMTTLLRYAGEAGSGYMNGLPMLLYQGAASFKLWTGKDMPVDIIKKEIFNFK